MSPTFVWGEVGVVHDELDTLPGRHHQRLVIGKVVSILVIDQDVDPESLGHWLIRVYVD